MTEAKEMVREKADDTLVIDAKFVKRGIADGVRGFFAPYVGLYEVFTRIERRPRRRRKAA